MKQAIIKLLSLMLSILMLASAFTACGVSSEDGDDKEGDGSKKGDEAVSEGETRSEVDIALDSLDEIDYGGNEFTIMHAERFKNEIWGENKVVDKENGGDQLLNDAVYERNTLLEEKCKLVFNHIANPDAAMQQAVTNEAATASGDFQLIAATARDSATFATGGYLRDYISMGVDLEYSWWDAGTADFALEGQVFFMNGAHNFADDNVTYVLIFNKQLRDEHANTVPNPYETVQNGDWMLDYFNTVIQGVSADNGDGVWNEKDTYGFLTTWEYGNTFFMGCDLRYVLNDRQSAEPTLFLDSGKMEKATNVLELATKIYHENNASFMSPPGQEALGLDAFKEGRGLFFGEVAQNLTALNREMDGDYGVLPVPKYDKAQANYRTWTHDSGSALSVTSAVSDKDAELVGDIIQMYAILSYQHVKPKFYDVMLSTKSVRDPESPVMLDIIFQNRVYDMAMYFDLGFYELFKTSVNNADGSFSSKYASTSKRFDRRMDQIMKKLRQE
ncbi:MAG: hypothetical protein IJW90_03700 [Clostridia bacterium]|nr:hypothetical protein [Clostridia bacterium]